MPLRSSDPTEPFCPQILRVLETEPDATKRVFIPNPEAMDMTTQTIFGSMGAQNATALQRALRIEIDGDMEEAFYRRYLDQIGAPTAAEDPTVQLAAPATLRSTPFNDPRRLERNRYPLRYQAEVMKQADLDASIPAQPLQAMLSARKRYSTAPSDLGPYLKRVAMGVIDPQDDPSNFQREIDSWYNNGNAR